MRNQVYLAIAKSEIGSHHISDPHIPMRTLAGTHAYHALVAPRCPHPLRPPVRRAAVTSAERCPPWAWFSWFETWLHKLQSEFHFAFDVEFIPTTDNYLADALSRAQLERFFAEARAHWSPSATLLPLPSPWQETRTRSWSYQLVSTRRSHA